MARDVARRRAKSPKNDSSFTAVGSRRDSESRAKFLDASRRANIRGGGKNSQPPLKDENFVGSIGAQRELRPPGITEIRRVHSE